jgi:hypothetical protein
MVNSTLFTSEVQPRVKPARKPRKPRTPKAPPVEQPIVPPTVPFEPFPTPAPAKPVNTPSVVQVPLLDLWPDKNGTVRTWLAMRDDQGQTEAYSVRLVNNGLKSMKSWQFQKHSTGATYEVGEVWNNAILDYELSCTCPGFAHNPDCCQGRGCKHIRMLKALRALTEEHNSI